MMRAVGRASSYEMFQPAGSAVNNSNSGALVIGRALDSLIGLSKVVPFGRQIVADPLQGLQIRVNNRGVLDVMPGLYQPAPTLTRSTLLPASLSAGLLASAPSAP